MYVEYALIIVKELYTSSQIPAPQNDTKIVQHSVNKLLKLKVAFGIFGRQECCSVSRTLQENSEHKNYSFECEIYATVFGSYVHV